MYDYISGKMAGLGPAHVVVDVGGVGYMLHISVYTHSRIVGKETVKLYVHLHVREDNMELYGFEGLAEREMFRHLIGVSGVGTNTARLVLSGLNPEEVRMAILSENIALFKSVKGIGAKTAQRIILDLKDKVVKEGGIAVDKVAPGLARETDETIEALLALGFQRSKIKKAIEKVMTQERGDLTTEQLIKATLKIMT